MKLKSKKTGEIQFIPKDDFETLPPFMKRKFEILSATDGDIIDILVPEKIIDFTLEELTVEEMKEFLKDRGVKFHHNLGDEKILELYNKELGEND